MDGIGVTTHTYCSQHGGTDKTASKYLISSFRGLRRKCEDRHRIGAVVEEEGRSRDARISNLSFWYRSACADGRDAVGRCGRVRRRRETNKTASKYAISTFRLWNGAAKHNEVAGNGSSRARAS